MAIYKELVRKISILADQKIKQKAYLDKGLLPIVDQGHLLIGGYTDDSTKAIVCDYPVIVFGDHTKCVKFITFPFAPGADGIKVLQPKKEVLPKYLYYGTQYLTFCIEDKGYARHYQYLEKKELIVPPLPEQERIVARIEELFSELDKAVETLKTTKQQLTIYRQAVLKEAFKKCDKTVTVESVCQHVTDGDHMPPPKTPSGIPFIMISNIDNQVINWANTAYVGQDYYNHIDNKRRPCRGDVLYTVTGSYGVPVLIDFEKKFCFQRHIALLRPNERINQKFLYYVMQEPGVYAQATKGATGTAQKTVGLAVLRKMEIPYIESISTQLAIVKEVETRMSTCDSIEKTVDAALQQAEALRQSILKQAFEGDL